MADDKRGWEDVRSDNKGSGDGEPTDGLTVLGDNEDD